MRNLRCDVRSLAFFGIAIFLAALVAFPSFAQLPTASILGTVKDRLRRVRTRGNDHHQERRHRIHANGHDRR